jgi:hypothetical protein
MTRTERCIVLAASWLLAACPGPRPPVSADPAPTPSPAVPSEDAALSTPAPPSTSGLPPSVQGVSVEPHLHLYGWVRTDLSIHQATVSAVVVEPADGGKERVTVTLDITARLWGPPGEPRRRASFVRPQSRTARLKFPDPVWGRVSEIARGMSVILVTPQPDEHLHEVTYINDVEGPDDPVVTAIRSVADVEKGESPEGRIAHYVQWLEDGPALHRRFAAEAVSKDADLPRDETHDAAVVEAYVRALETDTALRAKLVSHATKGGLIGRLRPQ